MRTDIYIASGTLAGRHFCLMRFIGQSTVKATSDQIGNPDSVPISQLAFAKMHSARLAFPCSKGNGCRWRWISWLVLHVDEEQGWISHGTRSLTGQMLTHSECITGEAWGNTVVFSFQRHLKDLPMLSKLRSWLGVVGLRLRLRRTSNTPDLRDAVLDDLPYIAHLLHLEMPHGHFFGLNTGHKIGRYIEDLRNAIHSSERGEANVVATVHTITVGGIPAGFYVLMGTKKRGLVDFNALIVEPCWRRRKVAAYTVVTVRNSLRERGYKMAVRCLPGSVGMMTLLEKLGFEEVHPREGTVRHYQS